MGSVPTRLADTTLPNSLPARPAGEEVVDPPLGELDWREANTVCRKGPGCTRRDGRGEWRDWG